MSDIAKKTVKRKKKKGEHSSPETSGIQNIPKHYINTNKGTGGGVMDNILKIYDKGFENRRDYKGKWDEDSLEKEIHDYFTFTAKKDVKPAKAGLRMWLGLSRSQYHEWETNKSSHPLKSDILEQASSFMELQYISKGEQFPTMNQFLLKSSHHHSDKQEVQITGTHTTSDEITDIVSKLGLDKEE